jgi:hypothetical protein
MDWPHSPYGYYDPRADVAKQRLTECGAVGCRPPDGASDDAFPQRGRDATETSLRCEHLAFAARIRCEMSGAAERGQRW